MANFLVNGGVILAYLLFAGYMLAYMRRVRTRSIRNHLSRKQYAALCLAAGLLFLKFWNIHQSILMSGQLMVLILLVVFGLQRRQAARKAQSARRIDVFEDGQKLERTIEEAAGAIVEKKVRQRDRKRLLSATLCVILVICLGIGVVRLFNSPNQGTIKQAGNMPAEQGPKLLTLNGQNFSLRYPESFARAKTDPVRAPSIETYDLLRGQMSGNADLAIQVESLPTGLLIDNGSYHLRQAHPERYSETTVSVKGAQVHIMNDISANSGFSRSAFFVHDGKAGIVTLTTGAGEEAEKDYETILQSWQWK